MIGLIPFAVSVVAILLLCYDPDAVRGQRLSGCGPILFMSVVWYVISFLCINGKRWTTGKQLGAYFACLFFPLIGWIVVVCSKNGGPKCVFCGSTMNPGATVCAKCGRDQAPRRPSRAKSLPCPFCHRAIPESVLSPGLNSCPHCGREFECEA